MNWPRPVQAPKPYFTPMISAVSNVAHKGHLLYTPGDSVLGQHDPNCNPGLLYNSLYSHTGIVFQSITFLSYSA